MRRWWKKLGILIGSLLAMALALSPAGAQFGPPGHGDGPPPGASGGGPPPEAATSMKDDGAPNAFSDLFGIRPRQYGLLPTRGPFHHLLPGIFVRRPSPGIAAEFPNPAVASTEDASPFTIQEGGWPNGFNELGDPRPLGHLARFFGGRRLLYTELLNPPRQAAECYTLTFRAEGLHWRMNGPTSVPLVTTDPNPTLGSFGQLSSQNTIILVGAGNKTVDYYPLNGYRLSSSLAIGYLPPLEVTGFAFKRNATVFNEGSLTNPTRLLAIPFQDVQPAFIVPGTNAGLETAAVIALPNTSGLGGQSGSINITSQIDFWGVDANFFVPLGESDVFKVEASIGYRHLNMTESLNIDAFSGGTAGSIIFNGFVLPQGFGSRSNDSFRTINRFDSFQTGLRSVLSVHRLSLTTDLKLALGQNSREITIAGSSVLNQQVPGRPTQTLNGGILALPSNSGTLSDRAFSFSPEINMALSYQVSRNCRIFGGYDFLYWTNVTRPGAYVNNIIDSRQIPTAANFTPNVTYNGPARPTSIVTSDVTAHGFFFGFEIGF